MMKAEETYHDPNHVTSMILVNNHYAYALFDTRNNKSITKFSPQLGIIPTTLTYRYIIELNNGRLVETNHLFTKLHHKV